MRLNAISKSDALVQQCIAAMVSRSTVLTIAEFYPMVGNAEYSRKAATASGGQFRALDAEYPANQITPAFDNPALKIFGDKVQVDKAHERRGADIASVRATELLNFCKNLGKEFQDQFFNADGTSNSFIGLRAKVDASMKIAAATNGLSVSLGNSDTAKNAQQKFLEKIDELIESIDGGAQALFMDSKTLTRLTTIAREFIQVGKNEFGTPVKYYNEVPLLSAGYDKDGSRVIGHTETCGTGTTCTSIYAVRFGEKSDLTIATNIGLEVLDLNVVGSHYVHQVELDAALALLNTKAAGRLEGIIIN